MGFQLLEKSILNDNNESILNAFFINDLDEYYSCKFNLNNFKINCFKDTQESGFTPVQCPQTLVQELHKIVNDSIINFA